LVLQVLRRGRHERARAQGTVRNNLPYLTKLGGFDIDLQIEGEVLLVRQQDKPGLIAAVAQRLASDNVNVSFMTVGRVGKGQDALMAIGIDSRPSEDTLRSINDVDGITEWGLFKDM